MGEETNIEWTGATWNPWQGCLKVSPGCKFCYMYRDKERYGQDPSVVVRSKPPTFNKPLSWKAPMRVFTCSWSDWFIEQADPWRDEAWDIIRATPHLTYQILTKRPERIAEHLPKDWGAGWRNVWLGVSVEDQEYADKRIPELLRVPARVRFLSCEPLLGPVDLVGNGHGWLDGIFDPGPQHDPNCDGTCRNCPVDMREQVQPVDWIIVGGESGPKARPMEAAWARSIVRQCKRAGVPVFVKQMGANVVDRNDAGFNGEDDGGWHSACEFGGEIRVEHLDEGYQGAPVRVHLRDRKGGDISEFPADLRVREFPRER